MLTAGSCIPGTLDGGATGFTNGYCSPVCGSTCIAGGECVGVGSFNRCFQTCPAPDTGRSTCRLGYVCVGLTDAQQQPLPYGICYPSCTSVGAGCQTGVCNTTTGQCE